MTNKEALGKIKQTCLENKDCNYCPLNDFCFYEWPETFPKYWNIDSIKEGE